MILIPIISLLGFCFFYNKTFNVALRFTLPIITSLVIIILYAAAMLNLVYYVTCVIYAMGIILFILYSTVKQSPCYLKLKQSRAELLFIFLLILSFAFYLNNANLQAIDDFTFWAIINQEILLNHGFETQQIPTGILKIHAHYSRGPSIFHYFMQLPGGYLESKALFSHLLLHLIYIAPLLSCRKWWHSALIILIIFTILSFYIPVIRSTYSDSIIALMFTSCFTIYFQATNKQTIPYLILPILIALPLFKEIGLLLSFIASSFIIMETYKKNGPKKQYLIYLAMLALPYIAISTWHTYFEHTHNFFERRPHNLKNLIELFQNFNHEHWQIAKAFAYNCFKFLFKSGSLATYIILILSTYYVKRHKPNLWPNYIKHMLFFVIGFIIYLAWRLYLYYFTFSSEEALISAAFPRYIGTYMITFTIIALSYIRISLPNLTSNKKEIGTLILLSLVCIFFLIKTIKRIPHNNSYYDRYIDPQELEKLHQYIQQGTSFSYQFSTKLHQIDQNISCYILNYKLKGALSKKNLQKCLDNSQEDIQNQKNTIRPFYN